MKDISAVLLATLFVVLSLMSLILAERTPEARMIATNNQERVSELGLLFAFKR